MSEYIKREDAIDAVLDVYYNTTDIDLNGEQLKAAILKVQPSDIVSAGRLRGVTYEDGNVTSVHIMDTDDVVKVFVPVRHGRWECGKPCPVCGVDRFEGLDADIWADWEPPYCPNCGAKMDGGASNG